MINIHRALNNDRLMRSLTGLNRKAFEALLPAFIAASQADRLAQVRKRAPGAGQAQKAKLSNPQQKLGNGLNLWIEVKHSRQIHSG
jgi:hypothetical protein